MRPNKPSKIYWLQPGRQQIGEQVFGAFLGVNEETRSQASTEIQYIKSTRHEGQKVDRIWLVFTVLLTISGWVIQFIGLRGLNSAVSLAQMGSTLLMAFVRTWLRTKRIGSDDNLLTQKECRLSSHKKQELDCFAFHLEEVDSFDLRAKFAEDISRVPSNLSLATTTAAHSDASVGIGNRLIQTRVRLTELTSNVGRCGNKAWHDLPIRNAAYKLANTIEKTMDLLSRWASMTTGICYFTIPFECLSRSDGITITSIEQITLKIERSETTLQWTVNASQLEAILGLWTWSLLKSNEGWLQQELGRLVGLHEGDARAEGTDLCFHKWMFCKTEAEMLSSKMISSSRQLFGFYSDSYPQDADILVVRTKNGLETMAAQDIYIHFLDNIFRDWHLSDQAQVLPGYQNGHIASSQRIDGLVQCFQSGNLGPREDALLCIVPVLRRHNILPDLAADTPTVSRRINELTSKGQWSDAFSVLRWLCKRCEGSEFERSAFELGRLCHRALMFRGDPVVQQHGYHETFWIIQADSRADYFKRLNEPLDKHRKAGWMDSRKEREWWKLLSMQMGWVAWRISDLSIRAALETYLGTSGCLDFASNAGMSDTDLDQAKSALSSWLAFDVEAFKHVTLPSNSDDTRPPIFYEYTLSKKRDFLCLRLAVLNELTAFIHWLMVLWAEVCKVKCGVAATAFEYAARSGSDLAIETLCRHGLDINDGDNSDARTALMNVVSIDNKDATARILAHGGKVNICHRRAPVFTMARSAEVMALLLEYGADIESTDDQGNTALQLACERNDFKTASFLLRRNARMDIVGSGIIPLINAAQRDSPDMIRFLLDNKADINVQSRSGWTALMTAACEPSPNATHLLLEEEADIHKRDNQDRTVFELLEECEESEVKATKVLLEEYCNRKQSSRLAKGKYRADSNEQ